MTNLIYYLVCDFGKAGCETIIDWDHCSRADAIKAVINGDHGGAIIAVHCIDKIKGEWFDASEGVALTISESITFEPQGDLLEFLQKQLGADFLLPEVADVW